MALDLQSTGMNLAPNDALVDNDSGQFVHICASVTKRYNLVPVYWKSNGRLWKRCDLSFIILDVGPLPQIIETEMSTTPIHHRAVRGQC